MQNKDEYFMNEALKEAVKAISMNEIPVGCVIVENNEIIARTHNLKETLNNATAHAEILAINEASEYLNNWRLDECTLYVTLEPCTMCAGAIVHTRLSRVVIGALDNKSGAVVSSKHIFENNHNHQMIVTTKVLEDDCSEILKNFLKEKRINENGE